MKLPKARRDFRAEYSPSLSSNIGLLLLCEVVAKPYLECYEFDFHADQTSKKAGKVYVTPLRNQ